MTTQPNDPPADDGGQDDGTDERLDRLEATVGRIEQALTKLVPTGTRPDARRRVERRLDAGSSIEEQVAAELDRRDKAAADKKAADEAAERERSTAARIAALEERPPAAPVKRATKVLGWGSPR